MMRPAGNWRQTAIEASALKCDIELREQVSSSSAITRVDAVRDSVLQNAIPLERPQVQQLLYDNVVVVVVRLILFYDQAGIEKD